MHTLSTLLWFSRLSFLCIYTISDLCDYKSAVFKFSNGLKINERNANH